MLMDGSMGELLKVALCSPYIYLKYSGRKNPSSFKWSSLLPLSDHNLRYLYQLDHTSRTRNSKARPLVSGRHI